MPHSLTIEMPEQLFQELESTAAQRGTTPEAVAVACIARGVENLSSDPLLKWAGAIDANVPDVAERHDEYLGRALDRELQGDRHE